MLTLFYAKACNRTQDQTARFLVAAGSRERAIERLGIELGRGWTVSRLEPMAFTNRFVLKELS